MIEIAAPDLTGTTLRGTRTVIDKAIKPTGDLLMITEAHTWHALPDQGQHVLRCLYRKLTDARERHHDDGLAIILAGRASPLRDLLRASPALAARFPTVIDFPGYTPGQLTAVFTTLAAEAGFTLTPDATRKAAAVLARAEDGHASGNARLAGRLLTHVTVSQARRITTASEPPTLGTISEADIPEHLYFDDPPTDDQPPGQYL